ncbi:unnamed protein product [Auanema sp. JU1783]|nr:unnamed protein product [Auanema sp. JU1783]
MIPLSRCFHRFRSAHLTHYRRFVRFSEKLDERTEDDLLLRTKDFRGVVSKYGRDKKAVSPEIHLAHLKQSLIVSGRVSGGSFFENIVKELEKNNESLRFVLGKYPDQWLSLILSSCGNAMSNANKKTREMILNRLWDVLIKNAIPISITAYNSRLRAMLENRTNFSVEEELSYLTEDLSLEPNQETFQLFLERTAHLGDIDACRNLVYEMARNGCIVDSICNQSLVYCFAVRGQYTKADSLVEKSKSKFDEQAQALANGACARAAAFRGDTTRLRQILRRSLGKNKKLTISANDLFETIFLLSEASVGDDVSSNNLLIEQIMNTMSHPKGFFHLLIREIERNISHDHFYTTICLLEDIKRISECLKNQQRSKIMEQLLARLSHQLIRNQVPIGQVLDIARRIVALFKTESIGSRFHDNLLHAALMYKDLSSDQRIDYMTAFIDVVDHHRERPHLLLPLLVSTDDINERLKILFRCSRMGYNDITVLGNELMNLVLQPLFDTSTPSRRETKLNKTFKVLKSYGVSDEVVWKLFHMWFKIREKEEALVPFHQRTSPTSSNLRDWLREHYTTFFQQEKPFSTTNTVAPAYERLKAIVDERDASKAVIFLDRYGWPKDTNYAEIGSLLVELVLDLEDWPTVTKVLGSLASQTNDWAERHGESFSPLKNNHLLSILRRLAQENTDFSIKRLIEYSYELKGMFPNATVTYDTFFDTLHEYNKLFYKIFEKLTELDVAKVDESMELLRTLIKLDILSLHVNETLTTVFVNNVLKKIGLEEGVNTWMKFQSSLSCSNGIVALLRHCLNRNDDLSTKRISYILHKAQNFTSKSRVHTLYCAVLLSARKYDDTLKYYSSHKEAINNSDFVSSYKLMNALKFKRLDEEFLYNYVDFLLTHSSLSSDTAVVDSLQNECIRLCQVHDAGPLSLKIYQRFLESGLEFDDKLKIKLWEIIGKHEDFARKWLYLPHGMLRLSENDPINSESEGYTIQSKLREDIKKIRKESITAA